MNTKTNNKLVDFASFLKQEQDKEYFKNINKQLNLEYKNYQIYPQKEDLFKSIKLCDFNNLKVVIVGQDPYHGANQADGLTFSTKNKILPPSLKNIFKEIKKDYPSFNKQDGNLENWAKQGILLQNVVLSVRESQPSSHYFLNWDIFSLNLFKFICQHKKDIVFILLGKKAQSIAEQLDLSKQKVFNLSHPSPFSYRISFENSQIFKKINIFLLSINKEVINWNV
ncbi:uracil-DNA glycosylase [Mesomycoplasma hyorhinis]|uniref:uracil-DNA glycosylase n=1 Tax=Mesomycoplasma hyorhinis TaxID=2100 RepID=UPI001C0581D4|nr:uracil-DNA glycosylase [Mesomycoplasma hyorhinis]